MILLLGNDAYSQFRMDALKSAIAKIDPELKDLRLDAKWVYAIQMKDEAFDANELARAGSLLNAVGPCDEADFFVTPRKGTISPWSTKATDIFRNCGLKSILRVERGIRFKLEQEVGVGQWTSALYDRMTEGIYEDIDDLFDVDEPRPGRVYDVMGKGLAAIKEANDEMGLAISEPEMKYLAESFKKAGRNPTDTELTMFGQVNSEHCRHKIFGAEFIIKGKKQKHSLFEMIKNTHKKRPQDTLSAYKVNSSVVTGFKTDIFAIDPKTNQYSFKKDQLDQLM